MAPKKLKEEKPAAVRNFHVICYEDVFGGGTGTYYEKITISFSRDKTPAAEVLDAFKQTIKESYETDFVMNDEEYKKHLELEKAADEAMHQSWLESQRV